MLTRLLKRLLLGGEIETEEMTDAIGLILDGEAPPALAGGFLVAARLKGETGAELAGAAHALRSRRLPVATSRGPIIDTCGTGGDHQNTFNISTAAALVAAAAGAVVAKQVGPAISSRAGCSDVLGVLGVDLTDADAIGEHCLEELGIGFFSTSVFHPALAKLESLRQELAVRTVLDLLVPLANPAGARRHLIGVCDRALLWPFAEALRLLHSERAWIVHGHDNLDEISVCAPTRIVEWTGEEIIEHTFMPEEVGLTRHSAEGLHGGTPEENAEIMKEVLAGARSGPIRDAVAVNAAAALVVAGQAEKLATGLARAEAILTGGDAALLLDRIREGGPSAEADGEAEAQAQAQAEAEAEAEVDEA